ncbi:restriction endonuclease subunit S [Carboxylicivirga linearis]|uniref:Restriction endonuclease subunit S n=1 Tax=Carboxylicivirga linearis TaxID=1628157 RepID=A0ABS5K1R4_9BACT|nr:restriction endonuclease subunit S [Carboxylicivirga linearis]MBS2101092.1 restriction endonuclease subunit S [Carboxylicivirga linearis]
MSEWQTKTLGEITDWFSGGTPSKQNESYWNGDIPWISARTLKGTRVSDSELKITEEGLSNGSRLAQKGDLLLLVRGSGLFNSIPISIVEKPVSFNQDIKAIRIKKEYDYISPWFLLYWLHGNTRILYGIMEETGIGAGKFDLGLLKDLTIELPPEEELKEITQTFKSIDDKIVLLTQQNQNLEELAQTIFKRWFVEFEFPNENGEPYKSSGGLMVESELGEIPDGWRLGSVGELSNLKSGYAFKSNDFVDDSSIKAIKIKDLKGNGIVEIADASSVSEQVATIERVKYFKLDKGDIVLAMSGNTTGKIGVIPPHENELYLNQRVGKLFLKKSSHKSFLYNFLMSGNYEERILSMGYGSAQPNINPNQIESIEILIPSKDVLTDYINISEPIYNKVLVNNEEIQALTQLRNTLLPKLMSGELRVKN